MEKPLPPDEPGISQPEMFMNQFNNKTEKNCRELDEEDNNRSTFTEETPLHCI